MAKRANGEGTIFQRGDGRWSAQVTVTLTDGTKKRVCVTKQKREDVKAKLDELLEINKKNIRVSNQKWTVGQWLDYWLNNVASERVRPTTWASYEILVRNYLKPYLGNKIMAELGVRDTQLAIDKMSADGGTPTILRHCRQVLSAALNRAMREELIFRNIVPLLEFPIEHKKPIIPWTVEEAMHFLEFTKKHPWHIAYRFQLIYGMRKGEVLGLRWTDIDWKNNRFFIRQQIGWLTGIKLFASDVKTEAGRRELPLVDLIKEVLTQQAAKQGVNLDTCFKPAAPYCLEGTVLINMKGTAVEPRNFERTFRRLNTASGLPRITGHTMRHTAATLMKRFGVPIKDAQAILGHSDPHTTQNLYQHGEKDIQQEALSSISRILSGNLAG